MPTMTLRELHQLGYRIKDGNAVKIEPTDAPKGRVKIDGVYRSKLEADYARHLSYLQSAGEVTRWSYEKHKVEITPKNWYRPDFMVVFAGGRVEYHETKGYCWDKDKIRINAAAAEFSPIPLVVVTKNKFGWKFDAVKTYETRTA